MPPLKNIFNSPWPTFGTTTNSFVNSYNPTRQLPNGGGSYSTEGTNPPAVTTTYAPNYNDQNAPAALPTRQYDNSFVTNRPIFNGGGGGNNGGGGSNNPSSITVSRAKSPEEIAAALKKTMLAGDISNYSYWAMNNPDASTMETANIARRLQDTQGDFASGATDPYKVASQSKWKFNAQELAAIEKAGAGVYDPAITSAITKLEMKQKADAEESSKAWEKEKLALQHGYTMEEKGLTAGGTGLAGEYVKGANPAVDAWAQRIFDGSAKITDIPASQKGMRDAVTVALMASGNDLSGKPTVTELGKAAKAEAESIMKDLNARKGTSAVGASRFWGLGGLWAAMPGTDAYDFKNSVSNLVSQLSLDGVKYLKGQGAVSDAERALLANAVTKLKLSQSEGEFQETLQAIIDKLEGNSVAGSVAVPAPDGSGDTIVFTD